MALSTKPDKNRNPGDTMFDSHPDPTGSWTLGRADDGPWTITRDGQQVDTINGHYDAWEALRIVEDVYAKRDLTWRLWSESASFGFVSTTQ